MVGPWDQERTEDRSGSRERRSQHARWGRGSGHGLALGKAEPGRETGTRIRTWSGSRESGARTRDRERKSRSPPPRREAQGRNEGKQETQNENETRKEQAKNGDRSAEENRDGEQKRGKTRIAEHTPTRNRTEADENETGDRAGTD
ncbi:hypothetical protein DFP73DRAFT_597552 [Morchella snyderi]|nr:hypothetical protein DFP73DRAFT_597552 [Morchella snyderi]